MKTTGYYQIFDNVGGTAITNLIPAQNRLTAALGFRNAYMINKDITQNPYYKTYKALELREIAIADVYEDGSLYVHQTGNDVWTLKGSDIIDFIQEEMKARGVDDFLLDDDKEE